MPFSLIHEPQITWLHPKNHSISYNLLMFQVFKYIGDDTQIQYEGKGSIKLEHGLFKNVLYFTSLATNLLFAYQMIHTGSPKRVVFDPDSVEITDISTGKLIEKGVANHASKAYEFSHFLPYSAPAKSQ